MTDNVPLNWGVLALSLFNAILLFWLGLTVLLNSDRRAWGIWLGGGGLLLGAAFFVSHSAILGLGISFFGWDMIFWWTVGLVPAIALPFAWYIAMLWYAGYWADPQSNLHRRQRPWLTLTMLLLLAGLVGLAVGIILLGVPPPSFTQLRLFIRWSVAGMPLMAIGYSVYVILCISLALDALRRPGPSTRVMGSLARRRARPWLAAASVTLLLVSLVVAGVIVWLVQDTRQQSFADFYAQSATAITWLDLIISTLIAISILLLGRAVVSYEVFTGKTLPRRGLLSHWRRAVLLAAGYSLLVGGTVALQMRSLYTVLVATLLMTLAFALAGWHSFIERERYISHLRPFVASQRLYEQWLAPSAPLEVDIATPFSTLCGDILGTRLAYLAPLGPLAGLVGPPLAYPTGKAAVLPSLGGLANRFQSSNTTPVSIDPGGYGGAVWAVPLWSQRGLSGVLLLGDKGDGNPYTQEEIEIARVSCERLIDTQASAELGRRLMTVQRQRLAQGQVVDLRVRRLLHDEILPSLQTALITLDGAETPSDSNTDDVVELLSGAHRQISDLLRQMPTATTVELARTGFVIALQRSVAGEYGHAFGEVSWQIEPEAAKKAQAMSPVTAEVLFYAVREAIRNAALHGHDPDSAEPLCLQVAITWGKGLKVEVQDNGVGLDGADPATAGGGQGLALHSTMMAVVGGTLDMESLPNQYTRVTFWLPEEEGWS